MSTIGSKIWGLMQGQGPGKGKAGHGNAAGAVKEGGFASAVASLSGREGDAGRKGGRLSVSEAAGRTEAATAEGRIRLGRRDAAAFAETLGMAGRTEVKAAMAARAEAKGGETRRADARSDDARRAQTDGGRFDAGGGQARRMEARSDESRRAQTDGGRVDAGGGEARRADTRGEETRRAQTDGGRFDAGGGEARRADTRGEETRRAEIDDRRADIGGSEARHTEAKGEEARRAQTDDGRVDAKGGEIRGVEAESDETRRIDGGGVEIKGSEPGEGRVEFGRRDAAAFAENLGTAGRGDVDVKATDDGYVKPDRHETAVFDKAALEAPRQEVAVPFGEKAAVLPDGKAYSERPEAGKAVRATDEPAGDDREVAQAAGEAVSAGTDVGNLLEMLAVPNVVPLAAARSEDAGAMVADAMQAVEDQPGGTVLDTVESRADAVAAGADDARMADTLQMADAAQGGGARQSDADQFFRLIRADGKGRDLDMSLSEAGDRATFRDASPTGPKGETVTVVDARRYIGLAPAGNAAAVTSAIAQDPQWVASLSATGGLHHAQAAATGKVVNTLKIQMHPIDLGLVTATLRLHGDDLVVSLQVETRDAYRQLASDQDAIVRALRDQGFTVDQVSIQLAPADRSASAQQGEGQGQQPQQFSGQPQAREGGNGRQGGGEGQPRPFAHEGSPHEGNTSDNAPGLAGGQPQRSGGVYL